MGLLNYITAHLARRGLRARLAERRAPRRHRRGPQRGPGIVALVVLAVFGVLVATAAVQTSRNADESASSRASLVDQVERPQGRSSPTQRAHGGRACRTGRRAAGPATWTPPTQGRRGPAPGWTGSGVQTGAVAATGPGHPGGRRRRARRDRATTQLVLDPDLQKLVNGAVAGRRRGDLHQRPAADQPVRDPARRAARSP